MTREDREALYVLAFETLQKSNVATARREIAELLGVDHINILVFGDMVKRGRELTEKPHAQ